MNGDLIAEKEYKDMANGGVKTWQWLKNLFKKSKEEMDDEEFIKIFLEEAKGKTEEIGELESDFNAEMVETAEMIKDKEIANEKTKEQEIYNENEKSKEIGNENIANPSKKIDEKPLENKQKNKNANEKSGKDSKNLAQDSFVKDFGDTYTEILAQANPKTKKIGQEQENQNDDKSVWNYFTAKEEYMQYEKQQGKVQSKKEFMQEFKDYAKKEMSVDEMRVLIALSNSKNSKLTPEQKLLIKDCLDIAQKENKNFQFLSEGHKAIIRANNNQMLGTQSIKDFLAFANTPKNKIDKLDNTILNNCKESCVKSIMANNKDLPQATITKLTALINPALAKTMEAGVNMGRTLTK